MKLKKLIGLSIRLRNANLWGMYVGELRSEKKQKKPCVLSFIANQSTALANTARLIPFSLIFLALAVQFLSSV